MTGNQESGQRIKEKEEKAIERANKIFRRNLDTALEEILKISAIGAVVYTAMAEGYEALHNYPVGSHLPIMLTAVGTLTAYQVFRNFGR